MPEGLARMTGFASHLFLWLLLGAIAAVGGPVGACAKTLVIEPGDGALQQAIRSASAGDTIVVSPGVHLGPIIIDKDVTVRGKEGAIIDGQGTSRVVTIDAPSVKLTGLTIRGSGGLLATEDSGVFVTKRGEGSIVENNNITGNLIGVYLKGPRDAVVRGNRISGRSDLRLNERGNGVHLWNTPGSVVEGNDISQGRDGIFVTTSKRNTFRDNRIHNVRFAVHYMYTNDSEVSGNVSAGNHLGYAIMYSSRIKVKRNSSKGDRKYGFLLNYANRSDFDGNFVEGANKCVFIYNANRNTFRRNMFRDCQIGIHFTAGSERNSISENAFIQNRAQVKYVGTRHIEWSANSRGNYWSDNLAFDLNSDGIADEPYKPNDVVDQLVWRHPAAKLLLTSPAVHVLRWAQSVFPSLYPGGVTDSAPLMKSPASDYSRTGGDGS